MASASAATAPDVPRHVYVPHRAGLPPLKPYFRDLMARRQFAAAFSRAGIRAANTQTVFGQLWLVLNPLLLALVYFTLVAVIGGRSDFTLLAHIAGGLFVFSLMSAGLQQGGQSVTSAGKLILNMPFPRLLLPLAAVRTAFFRFLPTVPVFFVIRAFTGQPWDPAILLSVYFVATTVLFSIGVASLVATLQVYFRDTLSFLPYFTRIWLYLSPVLWIASENVPKFEDRFGISALWLNINPMFSMVGGWQQSALFGQVPPTSAFVFAGVWAVVAAVAGALVFMSRERDFAVRL